VTNGLREAPVELLRALASFLEPPAPEHVGLARALDLGGPPSAAEYAETFLFQLHPYASVHLGAEGMLGGPVRDRIAGFWRAVGRVPPAEPDHLAALLGLYASLWEERESLPGAEAEMVATAAAALMREHLAGWVFEFLDKVLEVGGGYTTWARLVTQALTHEARRFGPSATLPVHLAEAPGLPDPRVEGGSGFLEALLAPVRTGTILTRATLVRIAREGRLGLRVGERRWVLEHLIGQAAPEVLHALATEADRSERRHRGRVGLLGEVARFQERRAHSTAALLRSLAAEGEAALVEISRIPV
jgi:hypothetical protein